MAKSAIKIDLKTRIIKREKKIWIVHPGKNRSHFEFFRDNDIVFLEYPGLQLTQKVVQDDNALRQRIRFSQAIRANRGITRDGGAQIRLADFHGLTGNEVKIPLRTIRHLAVRMQPDDLVVVPGRGAQGGVLFGEVDGPFDPTAVVRAPGLPYADVHTRGVRWLSTDRRKGDLPPNLVKYFEKPPAIAEVERDQFSERFFEFAYPSYVLGDRSSVSISAAQYDGRNIRALVPPTELVTFAIAVYRALEKDADLTGLSYDDIIDLHFDVNDLVGIEIKFASPGRYAVRARDALLAVFVSGFIAAAGSGALVACHKGQAPIEAVNSEAPNDPRTKEIEQILNRAANSTGGDALDRAERQAKRGSAEVGLKPPAEIK